MTPEEKESLRDIAESDFWRYFCKDLREQENYLSGRALDAASWEEFLQRKGRLLELRRLLALVHLWLDEAEELSEEPSDQPSAGQGRQTEVVL